MVVIKFLYSLKIAILIFRTENTVLYPKIISVLALIKFSLLIAFLSLNISDFYKNYTAKAICFIMVFILECSVKWDFGFKQYY